MEDKKPELVLVPLALMNDIMAYLGTKPFTEVAPYINALNTQGKIVDIPKESKTPEATL